MMSIVSPSLFGGSLHPKAPCGRWFYDRECHISLLNEPIKSLAYTGYATIRVTAVVVYNLAKLVFQVIVQVGKGILWSLKTIYLITCSKKITMHDEVSIFRQRGREWRNILKKWVKLTDQDLLLRQEIWAQDAGMRLEDLSITGLRGPWPYHLKQDRSRWIQLLGMRNDAFKEEFKKTASPQTALSEGPKPELSLLKLNFPSLIPFINRISSYPLHPHYINAVPLLSNLQGRADCQLLCALFTQQQRPTALRSELHHAARVCIFKLVDSVATTDVRTLTSQHALETYLNELAGKDINPDIKNFRQSLQKTWLRYLPVEQELLVLASKNDGSQLTPLFLNWLENNTGLRLDSSDLDWKTLFFPLPSSVLRAQALESLRQQIATTGKERHRHPRRIGNHPPVMPSPTLSSIATGISAPEIPECKPIKFPARPSAFQAAPPSQKPERQLATLRQLQYALLKGSPVTHANWISQVDTALQKQGWSQGNSYILVHCFLWVQRYKTQRLNEANTIRALLLSTHLLETTENNGRRLMLRTLIDSFGFQTIPANLVEWLKPLYSLAGMTMPSIAGDFANSAILNDVSKILRQVQRSIGLERCSEESLQNSQLQDRAILDWFRSQSGPYLATDLFSYAESQCDLDTVKGRQAFLRALQLRASADQTNKAACAHYLRQKCLNAGKKDYNRERLQPNLSVFFLDALLHIDAISPTELDELREFNKSLIMEAANASCQIMGYAREITRLAYLFKQEASCEHFTHFMLYALTLRYLKNNDFENAPLVGFLKLEVDTAESVMLETAALNASMFNEDFLAAVAEQLKRPLPLEKNALVYKVTQEVFNGVFSLSLDADLPGFLGIGQTKHLDPFCGWVYVNEAIGKTLPDHLRQHMHVQLAGIRQLSFQGRGDSYVSEGPYHQITLHARANGDPAIFKTTTIEGTRQQLCFLPPEDTFLPLPLVQEMNISQFWQNEQGFIYGYNPKGELVATVFSAQGENFIKIEGRDEPYFYDISQARSTPSVAQAVLEALCTCFYADTILVGKSLQSIWIPSIDLHFQYKNSQWICKNKQFGTLELCLPLSQDENRPFSYLNLRRLNSVHKKNQQALAVAKKRREDAYAQSLQDKELIKQIDQEIEKLEHLLQTHAEYLALVVVNPKIHECKEEIKGRFNRSEYAAFEALTPDRIHHYFPLALQIRLKSPKFKNNEHNAYRDFLEFQRGYSFKPEITFLNRWNNRFTANDLLGELFITQYSNETDLFSCCDRIVSRFPLGRACSSREQRLFEDLQHCLTGPLSELYNCLKVMIGYSNQFYHLKRLGNTSQFLSKKESERQLKGFESAMEWAIQFLNKKQPLHPTILSLLSKMPLPHPDLTRVLSHDARSHTPTRNTRPIKSLLVTQQWLQEAQKPLISQLFSHVKATPITVPTDVKANQENLIKKFQAHSPEQVAGFVFETRGRFNQLTLNQFITGTPETLGEVQNALRSLQGIGQEGDFLYVSNPRIKESFPREKLRAHLRVSTRLADADITSIERDVESFLSKAIQHAYSFTFFNSRAEAAVRAQLRNKQSLHRQNYLEAQDQLNSLLGPSTSLAQLQHAVLLKTVDSLQLSRDSQREQITSALFRFLIHKTEFQHIENTLQAPLEGERSLFVLLQMQRSYPIDLLRADTQDQERIEQLIQTAFLMFEAHCGFRCNSMQYAMFRSLMLHSTHSAAQDAVQARMGFGKTALLPLLAIVRIAIEQAKSPAKRRQITFVVPQSALEDNHKSFDRALESILGKKCVKNEPFTRLQIDEDDPLTSLRTIKHLLDIRLVASQELRERGNVWIQTPELRLSLEAQELILLEYARVLANQAPEKEKEITATHACLQSIHELRSRPSYFVFDELDDTQDPKSREVNYTLGIKKPIPLSTVTGVIQLVSYLQDLPSHHQRPTSELATDLLTCLGIEARPDLIQYVSHRHTALTYPQLASTLRNPDLAPGLLLIRALLTDPVMMDFATTKQPNTHFGVRWTYLDEKPCFSFDPDSNSAFLIAVPYEGTNTPKGQSVFENLEAAAIATFRLYISKETPLLSTPHLDFLIEQAKQGSIPKQGLSLLFKDQDCDNMRTLLHELVSIAEIPDLTQIQRLKEQFYTKYMQSPSPAFRKFLAMVIIATQIRTEHAMAKSDRYERGCRFDIYKGCSGTLGGTSSYFLNQKEDGAADGALSIGIMSRPRNSQIAILPPSKPEETHLFYILNALFIHTNRQTRALIDAAGLCKSPDANPETIVLEIWNRIQDGKTPIRGIKGIIYYNRSNEKMLYSGPNTPAVPFTQELEKEGVHTSCYFSFYNQKNTRGSDIAQHHTAHALVTLDLNVSNSDAKQAILRFRGLASRTSQQSFSFALTKDTHDFIHSYLKLKAQTNPALSSSDVAEFLRLRELDQEAKNAIFIFKKECESIVKQTIIEILHHCSQPELRTSLNEISPFVTVSFAELEKKYSSNMQEKERQLFIQEMQEKVLGQLNAIRRAATPSFRNTQDELKEIIEKNTKQLDASVQTFKKRYKSNTVLVQNTSTDTTAVAEAQAQGMAEVESNAATSRINQRIEEPSDSIKTYYFNPVTYFPLTLNFLKTPSSLLPLKDYPSIACFITTNFHKYFLISPHLQHLNTYVSHWILISNDKQCYIWITQAEAELFKSKNDTSLYSLQDARTIKPEDPIRAQIAAAVLRNNNATQAYTEASNCIGTETQDKSKIDEALKRIHLSNVDSTDLRPKVQIKGAASHPQFLLKAQCLRVTGKNTLGLRVHSLGDKFTVTVTVGSCSLSMDVPKNNPALETCFTANREHRIRSFNFDYLLPGASHKLCNNDDDPEFKAQFNLVNWTDTGLLDKQEIASRYQQTQRVLGRRIANSPKEKAQLFIKQFILFMECVQGLLGNSESKQYIDWAYSSEWDLLDFRNISQWEDYCSVNIELAPPRFLEQKQRLLKWPIPCTKEEEQNRQALLSISTLVDTFAYAHYDRPLTLQT